MAANTSCPIPSPRARVMPGARNFSGVSMKEIPISNPSHKAGARILPAAASNAGRLMAGVKNLGVVSLSICRPYRAPAPGSAREKVPIPIRVEST
ncbi:hypothetical protein GCM10009715_01850 [Paeniglutamicibacter psychrophenolicus]